MPRTAHLFMAGYAAATTMAIATVACLPCDDPDALTTACERIRAAVNEVEASCSLPPSLEFEVCGSVCSDYSHCPDDAEVTACTDAIRALGCDVIQSRGTYVNLEPCADIFTEMVDSCASSGASSDDD